MAGALAWTTTPEAQTKYMSVDEVKPGMKGYGLTVFQGSTPQRFDVEIISTLHNFQPGQDLFIVRTNHPKLDIARTVAGMSGSPIYIDGKMIGAYAYGWYFNVEPIAGVTPIANMLDDLRRPVPPPLWPTAQRGPLPTLGSTGSPDSAKKTAAYRPGSARPVETRLPIGSGPGDAYRFERSPLNYDLQEHGEQMAARSGPALAAPGGTNLAPATTDLMVAGVPPHTFNATRALLEPLGFRMMQAGAGGTGQPHSGPDMYVDGGVITVQLVSGDISMSGLGTVTHVVGDRVVAFGHPMLNGGIEALPTALGHVHWILSTQNRSFKIGEPTKTLGTLVNDRQASIVIDTTRTAPTFPVSVKVKGVPGAPKTEWNMRVAHDQFLAPNFMAVAIGSALESTTAERNDLTWNAQTEVDVAGYGTFRLRDFGSGNRVPIGPGDIARTRLTQAVGAVLNNPWQHARIEAVRTNVEVVHKRETMYLRGAQVLEPEIDAGQSARVRLTLVPYLGERQTRVVEIPLPRELAGSEVTIKLEPGYSVSRLQAAPENLGDLIRILPHMFFPGESLVASFKLPDEAGATFEGSVALRLPPGAADTLRPTSTSLAPVLFGAEQHVTLPMDRFVTGSDTVKVRVREVLR